MDKAPKPDSKEVLIKKVKGRQFAVVQFSGFWSEENFDEYTDQLLKWIKEKKYKIISEPVLAVYNPPWTIPFLRRNEVFVEVQKNQGK